MRKALAVAAAAVALAGASAGAAKAVPDPSGPAKYGLCKAYFAGSATGRQHKHEAGPFQALAAAADEAGDGNGTATDDEVRDFCADATPGGR
jgi:hypothetical protein